MLKTSKYWVEVPAAFRHDWIFHFVCFATGFATGLIILAVFAPI